LSGPDAAWIIHLLHPTPLQAFTKFLKQNASKKFKLSKKGKGKDKKKKKEEEEKAEAEAGKA
jgi:hypothetical protein